ncbi:metal-dependent hydrolase [Pseudovibrio sp. Tun.PSC04-5.I4]|uniref:metal-dependent hydrolase n=1 Tax=Pseudovibrio sp. Tun.PSC04-5.I4 TaxID=1798213 RepID=UPI00088064B2|nr:metal-dependent hydrolase [Pseudovibrio sp. Tun.PSC04-5.I4]SDR39507.1 L-ascorbate metabolism protein UlaG, beta-lactamase superfamily [Pseudovibrio sp. Tun.PSC04-5.I4]
MELQFLGHSAFKVTLPGATLLIDPLLTGNPSFPMEMSVEEVSQGVDHVLLTHGHDDHVGDAIDILKATGATLTANWEICMWAQDKGVEKINPMNHGGCVDMGAFGVALTNAVHSSACSLDSTGSIADVYLGNPAGLVVMAEGEPTLLHMGDTDIFSDMELINEIYRPQIGIVPIGDRFTMGARTASMACQRYFEFQTIIPCHYGTFPILDQNADEFTELMGDNAFRVAAITPGETVKVHNGVLSAV